MNDGIGKYAAETLRPERLSAEERTLLGRRLQTLRINRGMTQDELAGLANVSIKTVYHVERGVTVRAGSVLRLCAGLQTWPAALLEHLESERPPESSFLLYRASTAAWYAPEDRRRSLPEDNAERLLDSEERRRLGRLGLVPCFANNPYLVMPEGPGTLFLEFHARSEGDINGLLYRDAKILCLAGELRLRIAEETVELSRGDMVGYRNADLRWVEPTRPLRPDDPTPFILWMGAVRVGKVLKGDGRRTVVRRKAKAA